MRRRVLCGLKIASGAALSVAALLAITNSASAQYYDRFDRFGPRYERYDRYDRYRRYDPRYDEPFDHRRTMRRYPGDETSPPREVRHPKKKQREAEPKAAVIEKPSKGPYQVVVSIASQRVYLYGADGLIAQSKVSTGMRGHTTPSGVFSILEKSRYHRSNIYSGAPMPMMQRLTWSGIALHEGVLPGYPASHGCIRLNRDFATLLWNTTEKGARVIVAKSEIDAPVPIASPKLFSPIVKPAETITAATSLGKSAAAEEAKVISVAAKAEDTATDATPVAAAPFETVTDAQLSQPAAYKAPPLPARKGTIAAYISRKTGKLHVRYAMAPLFEMPIEIKDKDRLIGTHVITAIEPTEDGKQMSWQVVSIPTHPEAMIERRRSTRNKVADIAEKPAMPESGPQTAADALARIEIPKEAYQRIGELLGPGASLTISDYGISDETGEGTDFVVLTR